MTIRLGAFAAGADQVEEQVGGLGLEPLDPTVTQLLFRFTAAAYERRALGVASHWPFND